MILPIVIIMMLIWTNVAIKKKIRDCVASKRDSVKKNTDLLIYCSNFSRNDMNTWIHRTFRIKSMPDWRWVFCSVTGWRRSILSSTYEEPACGDVVAGALHVLHLLGEHQLLLKEEELQLSAPTEFALPHLEGRTEDHLLWWWLVPWRKVGKGAVIPYSGVQHRFVLFCFLLNFQTSHLRAWRGAWGHWLFWAHPASPPAHRWHAPPRRRTWAAPEHTHTHTHTQTMTTGTMETANMATRWCYGSLVWWVIYL